MNSSVRIRRGLAALQMAALALTSAGGWPLRAAARSSGQGPANWSVENVIKQLDAESKNFHSLTADIERTKVTVVVNDKSTETGQIAVRQDGKMRIDLTQPDPRTVLRDGDVFYIYNPKVKRVEEYNIGKHRAAADQFLLLGFGTSGNELKKSFLITVLGEETLDKKKAVLLELTPKSEEVRNQFSKIQLWIDESTWLSIQQKFFETGSGDYFTVHYTNIVRNVHLPDSEFKPHWPRGTSRVKPQA